MSCVIIFFHVVQVIGCQQRHAEVFGQTMQIIHGSKFNIDSVIHDRTIAMIEWADLFLDALPSATITLRFEMKGQNERTLDIQRH